MVPFTNNILHTLRKNDKNNNKNISSILSDDAALLFLLGTEMTGVYVCVCCVVARLGAATQGNDNMLIG